MRPFLRSLIIFTSLTGAACSMADETQQNQIRTIAVSGTGYAAAGSDMAIIRVGVETEGNTAIEAMRSNSERTRALLKVLKAQGVADLDLQTSSLNLQPRYDYPKNRNGEQTRRLLGYTAINTVTARVMDLDQVGGALDAAIDAGGNRIDSIQFDLKDPTEVLRLARDAAWQNALAQAEQLAALAGEQLGKVTKIESYQHNPGPVHMAEARALRSSDVPIQGGQQRLSVQLNVTWTFK